MTTFILSFLSAFLLLPHMLFAGNSNSAPRQRGGHVPLIDQSNRQTALGHSREHPEGEDQMLTAALVLASSFPPPRMLVNRPPQSHPIVLSTYEQAQHKKQAIDTLSIAMLESPGSVEALCNVLREGTIMAISSKGPVEAYTIPREQYQLVEYLLRHNVIQRIEMPKRMHQNGPRFFPRYFHIPLHVLEALKEVEHKLA